MASQSRVPSLVLHIGLPKTGTTFLQKEFFPRLRSVRFLDKPKSDVVRERPGPAYGILDRCFKRSALLWQEYGDVVLGDLLGATRGEFRPDGTVLVSDEGISTAGRRPCLLRAHLEQLRRKASEWGFRDVRVICTVRRQDQWLGSHYAQLSHRFRGASQQTFEEFVAAYLDPEIGYYREGILLDYAVLRDHLVGALDEDNVLMLPYELFDGDRSSYLRSVIRFLGDTTSALEEFEREQRTGGGARLNVRSSVPDVWTLRPLHSEKAIRLRPERVFTRLGVANPLPLRAPDLRREDSIRLTDALRARILGTYSSANRRLAADLGFDLGQYGYY